MEGKTCLADFFDILKIPHIILVKIMKIINTIIIPYGFIINRIDKPLFKNHQSCD